MKKTIIALGVVLTVLIAAVLIVPGFIDWSGYRVEIAQKVKQETGRDLLIGGDIVFSLVPSPVLRVNDIRLANASGGVADDMVSVRQIDVRVALMPLLKGALHVNSLRLIEPVIQLEMLTDGRGNWDLAKPSGESQNLATSPQSGEPVFADETPKSGDALPVQIDDFIIEKGRLIYRDIQTGQLEEIEELNSRFGVAGLSGPFEAAGTFKYRGINLGIEGSVGQIVHGRTASFASQLKIANGNSLAKISGTFVNLPEGPKLKGKLDVSAQSLAGLISAFDMQSQLPGGLDRAFAMEGEVNYGPMGLNFGKDGLSVSLGQDKGHVIVDFAQNEKKVLKAEIGFGKVDADAWLENAPYQPKEPQPLALVIEPSGSVSGAAGKKVSAALSPSSPKADNAPKPKAEKPFLLPKDINAKVSLGVEALMLKGEPVRQIQASLSLEEGEIALERLSAILPGAGELSLIGVAGERDGKLQFDGSLDLNLAHLRGALNWANVDVSSVPNGRLQQLDMKAQISGNQDEVRIYDLIAKMDGSTLKGASTIALRARPSFGANFTLDRFNSDAYIAPSSPSKTAAQKTAATQDDKTAPMKEQQAETMPSFVDALSVLNTFDANLVLNVGHLVHKQQDIRDISLDATVFNGGVSLRKAQVKDFAGLKLGASGALKPGDKGLMAENLSVSLEGKTLAQAAAIAGLQDQMDWKTLGAASMNVTLNGNVLAPDLDVTANVAGTSVVVSGSADLLPMPKLDVTLNVQLADLASTTRKLGLSYRPTGNPGALDVNADVSYKPSGVTVKNITGRLGKTELDGGATYMMGSRPFIDVNLKTGALNLDALMPAEGGQTSKTTKSGGTSAPSSSPQGTSSGGSSKWSKDRIDLSALTTMDGKVRLRSSALTYSKITARDVVVDADLKYGILDISKVVGKVFGGQAELSSRIKAGSTNEVSTKFQLSALNLESLLGQFTDQKGARGIFGLNGELSTQGLSQADFVSNLNGITNIGMQKVALDGKGQANSAFALLNFLGALSGKDPSKGLADVVIRTDIKQGIASLSSASLASPIANGSAGGSLDLPNWVMDVSGTLNMQQNAFLGLLASKTKMKSAYPFSFKGALDSPNVKLDTGGINSGGGLVIPLSDHAEKKGYGNLIRGILGAGGVKVAPAEESQQPVTPAPLPPASGDTGTMAPPPPPPGSSSSSSSTTKPPSVEQQLLQGLGSLLKKR